MTLASVRARFRSRRSRVALLVVLALVVAGVVAGVVSSAGGVRVRSQLIAATPEDGRPVDLDTSLYLPETTPAPAVLLSQGFGGDKSGLASTAKLYASDGYVVLAYSARGFGRSGGDIHFAAPDYEVRDGVKLLDYLSTLPQVKRKDGRPLIATAGASYGGGLSLLIAAADHRVGAVAADITWNDLSHALFPNFGASSPGVFKKLWAGELFGNAYPSGAGAGGVLRELVGGRQRAAPAGPSTSSCGRFAPDVCAAYQASAAAGTPNAAMTAIMRAASPAAVLGSIDAPTLLTQGEQDSLFPLSEADATARGLAAHGTPVKVVWRPGGHDAGGTSINLTTAAAVDWFGAVFGRGVTRTQPFRFNQQAGAVSAETGDASQQTLQADGYPGVAGTPRHTTAVRLAGPPQTISSPGGGSPAVITSIPGLGGLSNRFDQALTLLPSAPGQTATFVSAKLSKRLSIAGQSSVSIVVTTKTSTDATLFAGLRDLASDGADTLPSQLVSPIRLTGLTPGTPTTVQVRLPSFVRNVLAGHRLVLTLSSTDFAYAVPQDARDYTIALAAGGAAVSVPTVSGKPVGAGHPFAWLIVGAVLALLIAGAVVLVILRRRRVLRRRPELADVPVSIDGLVKEYRGGYRAVDDVSFRVEKGQVVGLLGPNGAGKTTALRVLVGLIRPTAGELHVFGEPVYPGAAVLARIGAFIEGPGFLPHLTGRENLRLFWAATGRPVGAAEFEVALDIAGLGASVDRRVRTYSHGMKQRLGIAQAMLGLPEVLVLDEPTNGLDPPQIAEMREMLQDYARTGRTVVVSSHLLAEVEQTCTHVVVMHKGRLVAAGSVAEIAGGSGVQLAVPDAEQAVLVLAAAGITPELVPARRALEDVFLGLIGGDE
ncbi:ATP-binding cassette domain-containing protein [uncultured Jatrophihabitans sp.]|uniref:ATP-binding cassette domain-containing protein n=1 Tax=uncultured Jatrophihabitans sp. TaxID=1610747 RepID=UPI0035CBDD47